MVGGVKSVATVGMRLRRKRRTRYGGAQKIRIEGGMLCNQWQWWAIISLKNVELALNSTFFLE
jgi:hypothetical protein